MRLEINAGGLDSFFNGVCSLITVGINNATSDSLINSFQNVTNKTCGISGGVGTLSTALGYINTRKTAEETRKIAVQNVRGKTDNFIQTSLRVDKSVAGIVKNSTEAFYRTNPWLRPPAPPSDWDRFCSGVGGAISGFCGVVGDVINSIGGVVAKIGKFFLSVGEAYLNVLNGIKEWAITHWKEILIAVAVAVAVVAVAVLTVATFGVAGALFAAVIGASIGALCGAGGQLISDVIMMVTGKQEGLSSWQTYVGAVAGGAITGLMTACGHPALGGAVGGYMSKFIGGTLEGKTTDEIFSDMAIAGAIGLAVGAVGGLVSKLGTGKNAAPQFLKVTGINSGRNSFSAVYKRGLTMITKGYTDEMSWKVFFKGTVAKLFDDLPKNVLKAGAKSIYTPTPAH